MAISFAGIRIETRDEARGKRLMDLVNHPLVCGPGNRAGLFWFTISPIFAEPAQAGTSASSLSTYLERPGIVFNRIWALPDHSLHALDDGENSPH